MADKSLVSQYDGTHVKVGDRLRRFDKGAVIPDGADEEHVKVLLERGLVAKGEPAGGATGVDPDVPPPFPLPSGASKPSRNENDAPAGNASLDEWRAFALKQDGVTEESIADLSRDDLRDQFGSK